MEHLVESGKNTLTNDSSSAAAHQRRRQQQQQQQQSEGGVMMTTPPMTDYSHAMENDGVMVHDHPQQQAESHMRSLLKGLTWRIVATSTTTVIAYWITGQVSDALQIGFFEFFAKLAIYYVHERIWTQIRI